MRVPQPGELPNAIGELTHGKGNALAIVAAKLGRAVYHMLRKQQPFAPATQ